MRFNKLDMNLLAALDILLNTRSVTKAADRMFITQSAMSNALGRLREYFDDPLFVQVGRQMELTPLAETLEQPVREIMLRVEAATQIRPVFDAASAARSFDIAVSDYSMTVLGPCLSVRVAQQAPNITINMRPQHGEPQSLLDHGDVDLLVIPEYLVSERHESELLFIDEMVVLVSEDSQHAKNEMTLNSFCEAQHVLMEPLSGRDGYATLIMREAGIEPKKAMSSFLFSALPSLIRGTERIALIHRRLAEVELARGGLVMKAVPFDYPPLRQSLTWQRHKTADPGLQWLRQCIHECATAGAPVRPDPNIFTE